eukprot:GHUV01026484.1.p1 GENE.GHUV01026484.1~~GHUV01026484.1.p1  ORF type:complete len:143 (+),score=19.28 GHUV01026484.1:698-1126(+)
MSDQGSVQVGQVVAPGDAVQALPATGSIRIGTGLRADDGYVVAQKCGIVRQTRNGKLWLESRQKRCERIPFFALGPAAQYDGTPRCAVCSTAESAVLRAATDHLHQRQRQLLHVPRIAAKRSKLSSIAKGEVNLAVRCCCQH